MAVFLVKCPEGTCSGVEGGTLLGSSRGPQAIHDMIDTLVRREVGILFTIGGDGTLRGTSALSQEIQRRGLPISIIGIPMDIGDRFSLFNVKGTIEQN